ncbi:MAG TPA: hypothetical protein VM452_04950 [Caulifigura sp.]|nr:hypothetical protein [Caulifigura sp.]
MSQGLRIYSPAENASGDDMARDDERLDRVVEALQQINVNLEGLRVALVNLTQTAADHEDRLRSVERWRNHLTPLVAALTFVLGAVCSAAVQRVI